MPKRKPKPIGEQLKAAREARGLNQKQVAEASGIDPSLLSKFERGDPGRRLVHPKLKDLARVLRSRVVTDRIGTRLEKEK